VELFLIRHAQSLNNARPAELRVEDPELTQLGREQARRLGDYVQRLDLTRLITSPFRRALDTAHYIRQTTGLVPEVRIELHEKGGCVSGVAPPALVGRPGMTREQILSAYPGCNVEPCIDGAGWWRSQPYESVEAARVRADRLLAQARTQFASSHERVAFVTHGDFELLFLGTFHPLPLVLVFNASITRVEITPDCTRLVEFNQVEHLPDEMLSW